MKIIYLVRHGEVEHHHSDVGLTPRGREQARAAGLLLAGHLADAEPVFVFHSPVARVKETATIIHRALDAGRRAEGLALHAPQPDVALHNVRFILETGDEPDEPSLLFEKNTSPAFLGGLPPERAEFYRGFWASRDPMGYWLNHDGHGGAETPAVVLDRMLARVREILSGDKEACWILVTHSGAMRVLLRHALRADPGEPDFCEVVKIETGEQPGRARLKYRDREAYLDLV